MTATPENSTQFPADILNGNVIAACYDAIETALKTVMPDNGLYRYVPITPRPRPEQWREFTGRLPVVGIGWAGWRSSKLGGTNFRGPLLFSVAILTEHRDPQHLYKGDGKLAGTFGVTQAAISVLNRLTVSGAGTAYVVGASSAELAEFLSEGQSSVLLTIEFDNVALDEREVVSKLDTLKTIYATYVDSETGAVL